MMAGGDNVAGDMDQIGNRVMNGETALQMSR
jgi:hypothetical protein